MSYEDKRVEILKKIRAQKDIYQFRVFLYSLNRDVRQTYFRISKEHFENELQNQSISVTERQGLQALIAHWNWTTFDTTSLAWWTEISSTYATNQYLLILVHLWIDDITKFDSDDYEKSTDRIM